MEEMTQTDESKPLTDDVETDAPEVSLRESLDAAFEQSESSNDEPQEPAEAAPAPSNDATEAEASETKPDDDLLDVQAKNPPKIEKPPINWNAEARETWSELPESVKTQVAERERQVNMLLQQTATERKAAQQFAQTLQPYQNDLQQMGFADPFQAVKGVLDYAMQMRKGTPQQRAQAAANVIKDFGIDIDALDDALSGASGGNKSDTGFDLSRINEVLDQRLQPVNTLMSEIEQARAQHQQTQQQQSLTQVSDFMSQHEFAEDVRMDMADLMDLAAQRGQTMTLEEAYERACQFNPHVRQVLASREQAQAQHTQQQNIQNKRLAASSVSGNPSGNGTSGPPATLADALNEAWNLHVR